MVTLHEVKQKNQSTISLHCIHFTWKQKFYRIRNVNGEEYYKPEKWKHTNDSEMSLLEEKGKKIELVNIKFQPRWYSSFKTTLVIVITPKVVHLMNM